VPDLATRLRDYVEEAAPPIALGEVEGHPLLVEDARVRWRRCVAVAAALVLIAAAAVLATRPDPSRRVVTGTTTVPERLDWLTPLGDELPMPDVPAGWKLLDFEAIRFAVPQDWPVVQSCDQGQPENAVVLPLDLEWQTPCDALRPWPMLRLRRGDGPRGLAARSNSYSWEPSADMPEPTRKRVLGSFTDSGARRALQRGPIADTRGWRTVELRGVAVEVPPDWLVVDLPAAPALVEGPGSCGQTFASGRLPTAYVDGSGGYECRTDETTLDLGPGEGIWLQRAGEDPVAEPITQGRIGGLDVTVVDIGLVFQQPDPALDLVVETGEHWLWLSIGVGEDASVARAILRSLHRA
jgi:hypothetical protein